MLGVVSTHMNARPTNGNELSDDAYKIVGSVNDDIW